MYPLCTQRLSLRPLTAADARAVRELLHEPAVRKYLCDDALVTDAQVHAWVEASDAAFTEGRPGLWTVSETGASDVIGLVGFIHVYEPPVEELIFAIATAHTRRGFATESARAVISWSQDHAGMTTIRASTDEPNLASVQTLTRLGFVPRGTSTPANLEWRQLHFELEVSAE